MQRLPFPPIDRARGPETGPVPGPVLQSATWPATWSNRPEAPAVADRPPLDLVERAAAILGRETAMSMSPASPPVVTETAGAGANPGDALAGIQSRAMSALAEVFGLLGRGDRADSSASTFSARASGASALPELQIPWYRPAVRAAAGTETAVELPLENLEDDAVEVRFYSSELSSDGGTSIPSVAVSFDPTTVVLGPRQQAVVTVTVEVPRQAVPGAYSGLVQAEGLARVKAVITVEVD